MTTANNPVVTAELLRETLGRVIDVLDDAGGFSDVPAVREAKRVYIMSRAALQSIGPMRGWDAMVDAMIEAWSDADAHHDIRSTCEDLLDAALQSIGQHRANPVVDVEGMVERVGQQIANAMQKARDECGGDRISFAYAEAAMRSELRAAIEALNSQGDV